MLYFESFRDGIRSVGVGITFCVARDSGLMFHFTYIKTMFNTDRELNTRVTTLECRWKCSCDTAFWQFPIQASVWGAILVKKTDTNIYSQCVGCRYCCHDESNNNAMRNNILEYDISIYDALNCHSDIKPRSNRFVYGFKIHSTSTIQVKTYTTYWLPCRNGKQSVHWVETIRIGCVSRMFFRVFFGACDIPNCCWSLLCFVFTGPNYNRYRVAGVPT